MLRGSDDALDPGCPVGFGEFAGGGAEDHCCLFNVRAGEAIAIDVDEDGKCRKGGSLISVYEGVIAKKSPGQHCSKHCYRCGFSIGSKLFGTSDGGLQGIFIADARQSSIVLHQSSMHVPKHISPDKLECHFASSR